MKSIRQRLDGHRDDFLRDAKLWGIPKTMTKYGFKDYVAVKKYVIEETGDENYGLRPQLGSINSSDSDNALEVFIQKFADFVVRKEAEVKRKDERIELLETRLSYYEKQDMSVIEDGLVSVMEACES